MSLFTITVSANCKCLCGLLDYVDIIQCSLPDQASAVIYPLKKLHCLHPTSNTTEAIQ